MTMHLATSGSLQRTGVYEAWQAGDEERLIEILGRLTPSSSAPLEDVIEVLRAATSDAVRAAAAMALVDVRATDAVDTLKDVIRRPGMASCSGTLLYALSELGASIALGDLVDLIGNGSFEARAEALTFLSEGRIEPFAEAEWTAARQRLAVLATGKDDERAEAAALALDGVDELTIGAG